MKRWLTSVAAMCIAFTVTVAADDPSLSTARDLYAAAAYEDALTLLNRLRTASHSPDEHRGIEQYRAFCLFALGRTADAEQAIEAVVKAEPLYQPSDADISPRLRIAFSDVRRRMLPGIIQEQYARAKAAYDRKEFNIALTTFAQMLTTLADPAVGAAATQPPLSDLRVLAVGFQELSAAAVASAAAKVIAPPAAPAVPPAPVVVRSVPPPPAAPRIYGPQDGDVVPPAIIRQALPEYDIRWGATTAQAVLEVVIDESGAVESVALRGTIHPNNDALARSAARSWRYKPATLQGVPVKYPQVGRDCGEALSFGAGQRCFSRRPIIYMGGTRYTVKKWNPTGSVGFNFSPRFSIDVAAFGTTRTSNANGRW